MPEPAISNILRSLPDALTASFFLLLWADPMYFGPDGVRNGMLIMLVEFIVVHASGFLGQAAFASDVSRLKKAGTLAVFTCFYLIFIVAWSWSFKQWWPFVAFGWLIVGKFSLALTYRPAPGEIQHRMQSNWALSALVYLLGAFVTVMLPWPKFGITSAILPLLDLPGSGLWINEPHRVIGFGCFYFSVLAILKCRNFKLPANQLPGLKNKKKA